MAPNEPLPTSAFFQIINLNNFFIYLVLKTLEVYKNVEGALSRPFRDYAAAGEKIEWKKGSWCWLYLVVVVEMIYEYVKTTRNSSLASGIWARSFRFYSYMPIFQHFSSLVVRPERAHSISAIFFHDKSILHTRFVAHSKSLKFPPPLVLGTAYTALSNSSRFQARNLKK